MADQNDTTGLSRRRLLGSVATIGGAAALGGAGSVAFLSDREDFANNRLVAGELDLKVDWEEHYSDWSEDESDGLENEVYMDEDDVPDDLSVVGLPDPTDPLIFVAESDLATFMNNTAIEAYPDTGEDGGDGVQDAFAAEPGETTEAGVGYICEDGADTPEDLDPNGGTGLRTLNEAGADGVARGEATVDADGNPLPIIDIEDVKPGDFGELTLSYHLCDNPGFVYLQADDVLAEENGYTEAERKDEDESGDADGDGEDDTTELLDEIQTTWWYDDGDNVIEDESVFFRGSLREALDLLTTDQGVPLDADPSTDAVDAFEPSTTNYIGFTWYLPVDHANEIQTDSVQFDLGFYAEQARHNEAMGNVDDGPEPECPTCPFDIDAEVDGFTNLLSAGPDPSSGFPAVDARLRVDSAAGVAGDLTASNFAVCEDGCGQTIEDVAFESGGAVDIAVVFDDTGSMFNEIDDLKSEVSSLTDDIEAAGVDARYALISFKDVVQLDTDFTDAATFQSAVNGLFASGGGDTPEDNVDSLGVATRNDVADQPSGAELSSYRSGAQRIIIDITDVGAYDSTVDSRAKFTQTEIEGFIEGDNYTYYAVAPESPFSGNVSKRDIANNVDDGTWIDINGADFDVILNDIVGEITEPAYVLSYTTTNPVTDGSSRTVDVEITDPDEGTGYEEGGYSAPSS